MRQTLLLLTFASMLAACGLKGPLFLPQPKPAAAPPASAPLSPIEQNKASESK